MRRSILTILAIFPSLTHAADFARPIPQAQSATAEWWFFAASVALLTALLAVHLLVGRR